MLEVIVVKSACVRLVGSSCLLLGQDGLVSHCGNMRLVVFLVELSQRISTVSRWNSLAERPFSGS